MRKTIYVILAIALIGIAFWIGWSYASNNTKKEETPTAQTPVTQKDTSDTTDTTEPASTDFTSTKGVKISVTEPLRNAIITDPLTVKGSIPGNWSFEASFPIRILDADRNVVAQSPATLQGDWMTDALVPFTASIPFTAPDTPTGYLLIEKDNPSGEAENADSVEIPIRFR